MDTFNTLFDKDKLMKLNKSTMEKAFFWLVFIVSAVLTAILAYWLILKLTNHSPSMDQVFLVFMTGTATVILFITSFLFKTMLDTARIKVELKHTNGKLDTLCCDFKELRSEFGNLSFDMRELRRDFAIYASKKR